MPTFFGPWAIRATTEEGFFSERFVISGSAGSDGTYVPDVDGTPLHLSVDGDEWVVDCQGKLSTGVWTSYEPDRSTAVVPPQGLTVTLWVKPITLPDDALVFNHLMVLRCVCLDPEINPPWPTIPVDLTLPES